MTQNRWLISTRRCTVVASASVSNSNLRAISLRPTGTSRSTPSVPRASQWPSAITRPLRRFTPIAVATALMVTPAQATSASRSISAEQPACPPRPWPDADRRRSRRPSNARGRRRDPARATLRRAPVCARSRAARDTAFSAAPAARAAHSHPCPDPIYSAIIADCVGSKAGQSKGTRMPKQIRVNAFDMNCVAHQSPGLWAHPRDRADRYNTLDYWVELAGILERGKFDALFLADVLGVYDVYRGSSDAAIANAVQVPVNDPLLLIPAMAYATRDLGFGVTCAVSYEHPYTLARRFSTLDHLTSGRIGWNIVTGYLNSAAKGMGLARQPEHDTRYEIAEEYMEVVYKLWEGSWEDGAVLRDQARRIFARPDKVHRNRHDGTYFPIEAIHLCEPSPQRTPLLYQAGASSRGRQFAATHAECVFVNGPSKQVIKPIVADIRRQAEAAGRSY